MLRENDKMKEDTIANLSDKLIMLSEVRCAKNIKSISNRNENRFYCYCLS